MMHINIYIYYHTLVRVPDSGPGFGSRIWDPDLGILLVVVVVVVVIVVVVLVVVILVVVVVVVIVIIVTSNHGEKGPGLGSRIRVPNSGPEFGSCFSP